MTAAARGPRYPEAARLGLVESLHGQQVCDPYRWLEDPGDPGAAAWLAAQERLYAEASARWRDRGGWHARLAKLTAHDRAWAPVARGARIFQRRQRPGQEHPDLFVLEGARWRRLLSPAALDPGGRAVLEAWTPSVEGRLLAYQVSADGAEDSLLWVLDVATGKIIDGPIDRVRRTPVAWLPGGTRFYYVRRLPPGLHPGEERYHRRVYLHQVGTDADSDVLIFGEGRDKTQFYDVSATADGRWLTLTATCGASPGADVWLADLLESSPREPRLTQVHAASQGRSSVRFLPGAGPADAVWLRTTCGAQRGRVIACVPGSPAVSGWRELIAERPDAVLLDLAVLVGPGSERPVGLVSWSHHATAELTVHDLSDGRELGSVALPGAGWVSAFSVRPEGGPQAWFVYTDHVTPQRVLRYDARDGRIRSWPDPAGGRARSGGGRPPEVSARQVSFPSRDGTRVRMFVISQPGRPGVPRPAILTGYGGFGVPMRPSYLPEAMAWAQAGGVYAIACLRGGGEEGDAWHRAGRAENKQNTFDDFDAAADHLVREGWASPGRLAILGGSNGGLLVGAALTQHPEKYAAAVCVAPLLDMARYELSGMGPSWRDEYGSAADPDQLRVLLSYSPYHRVRCGVRYPAVLFAVFDGDTRVDPLHARKMCAAMQHASSGEGPVLLRLERGVGHGARAASRELALAADFLAFLGHQLGLALPAEAP